jgi:hypothetical protein
MPFYQLCYVLKRLYNGRRSRINPITANSFIIITSVVLQQVIQAHRKSEELILNTADLMDETGRRES